MQVTHVLKELSQRDYTTKTVTGTKRQQTNYLKEESTYRQKWEGLGSYGNVCPLPSIMPM